jgi:hypothetical protein
MNRYKIKDDVDFKELSKYGVHYDIGQVNGVVEGITKIFPFLQRKIKTYCPYERYECKEFGIFTNDEERKIQFKIGFNENNSEIFKKMKEDNLIEVIYE